MKKRGIVFTLIALLLAGMFILLYTTEVRTPLDSRVELEAMRVHGARTFSNTLEEYLNDVSSNAAHDGLRALLLYENETGGIPASEDDLRCMLADVMMDGMVMNYTAADAYVNVGDRLTANLDIFDDTGYNHGGSGNSNLFFLFNSSPTGGGNGTRALLIPLLIEGSFNLGSVNMSITSDDVSNSAVLELHTQECNRTIFLMDAVNVSFSQGQQVLGFDFPHHPRLEKSHGYFFLFRSENPVRIYYMNNAPLVRPNITFYPVMNVTIWNNHTYPFLAGNRSNVLAKLRTMSDFANDNLGIDSNAYVLAYTISQQSTWSLWLQGDAVISIKDNFSWYSKRVPIDTFVSVQGLPEPLTLINRHMTSPIRPSPHGVDYGFNISILAEYYVNRQYWERYNGAPNFMYRMMNWTKPSSNYGFETVLNESHVNRSSVDWMLYSGNLTPCSDVWVFNKTYIRENGNLYGGLVADVWAPLAGDGQNVTLDTYNLLVYNITSFLWNTTCP